jgi:hypothetical protein
MDLSTVKSVTPNRHILKKIIAIVLSIAIIIVSFSIITNANKDAKETIEVLRVNLKDGIPAYVVITEKDIERYNIIKKEYTSDMVLAKNIDTILNKFTKYYLRNKSILFQDQFINEKPQRNEWLYKLEEEQEVLTFPYDFLQCGGDILMPGDRVRIRASYEVEAPQGGNSADPYGGSAPSQGTIKKTEVLFDSIVVKDMLNSRSHSIYEMYKEVLKLGEDKRQEVMKSEDFLENIQPKALLLEGSRQQIDNFAKYKSLSKDSFLITILSRSQSNVIIDQLPTLQREVESWIEKNKK